MTTKKLRLFVQEVREELGTSRRVLEAVARAMHERRALAASSEWPNSKLVDSLGDLLDRDDALGVVYQALNAPALEAAYRGTARERRKFTAAEIPAVTGLFTPRWVAEFLLKNSLPASTRVRDTRILDPACGTMNFGLAAIDLLRTMYLEEMDCAGRSGWPAEPSVRDEGDIAAMILRHNLFGCDIDPTALWLARLSLGMKLRVDAANANLVTADALFDDVGKDFDVVVTNPPYLSARNLPEATVRRIKQRYPFAWRDLYACFIDRCIDLCRDGGRVGLLTMQSFMFTGAFERLRERIDDRAAIEKVLHFGPGLFDAGNPGTLQTVAFTLRREADPGARAAQMITAMRLVEVEDKENALKNSGWHGHVPMPVGDSSGGAHGQEYLPMPPPNCHRLRQLDLRQSPRGAWVYWATPAVRHVFATFRKLGDVAPPRQGLATTDNARFVRYWWEVEPTSPDAPCRATPGRWFAYAKSGRFRRWYEAPRHRVNWEDDGREIKAEIARRYPYLRDKWQWVAKNAGWYGKPGGVTYSYLTSGRFSARRLEPGSIFDVAGSSLFPPDPLALLALLNSTTVARLLHVINPTVNFQVGDLAELPVSTGGNDVLRELAVEAIELQRQLDAFDETSTDFRAPMSWRDADEITLTIYSRLRAIEKQVDHVTAELYGIPDESGKLPESFAVDRRDLARRWVSFALRRALERSGIVQLRPAPSELIAHLREELDAVDEIESAVGGLDNFLASDFYAWHVRLYAKRPVYWAFGDRNRALLVAHDHADAPTMKHILRQFGESLPRGWNRSVDDGVAADLAPLAGIAGANRGSNGGSGRLRSGGRSRSSAASSPTSRSAART